MTWLHFWLFNLRKKKWNTFLKLSTLVCRGTSQDEPLRWHERIDFEVLQHLSANFSQDDFIVPFLRIRSKNVGFTTSKHWKACTSTEVTLVTQVSCCLQAFWGKALRCKKKVEAMYKVYAIHLVRREHILMLLQGVQRHTQRDLGRKQIWIHYIVISSSEPH